LPWDDREAFIAFHDGLKKELFPSGPSEEECVLDLALLHWQKRTLWRMRTASVCRDRFTDDIVATDRKSWVGIRKGLREKAREDHTLLQTLEAGVASAVGHVTRLTIKLTKERNPAEAEQLAPQLIAAVEVIIKKLMPLLEKVREWPDAERAFDKHYLPEDLEKLVRIETAIDARITKVLARLVALKEFKRTPAGSPLAQLIARSDGLSRQAGD
jgi:hypothetical protein